MDYPRRFIPRIRLLFAAMAMGIVFSALNLMVAGPALAVPDDIYTVRAVPVDATAETAAAARESALAEGHALAFQTLLARIVPRDLLAQVPVLDAAQIAELVKYFQVNNERTSSVRYLADLTFLFKSNEVRKFLRGSGVQFAETRSKPVLVLPVFGPAGEALLWEEPNPWRAAWARRQRSDWLVPLIVPLGDLGDVSAIDANQALQGDVVRLSALARRYGAEDAIVTQAVLTGDYLAGQGSLQIGTTRLGTQQQTLISTYAQAADESIDDLFARAVEAVDGEVQEAWKQSNLLVFNSENRLSVFVPVTGLEDLLEVTRRLRGVATILHSNITLLSRSGSVIDITYIGDEQQLALALAQRDLVLAPSESKAGSGEWVLHKKGAQIPASANETIGSRSTPGSGFVPEIKSGTDQNQPSAGDPVPPGQETTVIE